MGTSESEMVHVNGKKVGGNANICKFTAYVSPYFVLSNGGAYTKHIYAASQRIASKLGNVDGFGADPRRVEQAGGKKYSDIQKDNIGARYKELGFTYSAPEKEKVEKDSTMDSESEEKLIFFYHPDHLGSTSYVTDADGNIAQHIEYIPYGEVFVEERNSQFSTNYLFNAKELDNETGLYYYGARYLDPTGAMWLSVDPMWEKYAGMSPYNYCMGNPVKLVDPDGNAPESRIEYRGNGTFGININNMNRPSRYYMNLANNDPSCWRPGEIGLNTTVLSFSYKPNNYDKKLPGIDPADRNRTFTNNAIPITKKGELDKRYKKPRIKTYSYMGNAPAGGKASAYGSLILDAAITGLQATQSFMM
ncbi:MAG: hypothetical protein MJZ34_15600, partial [Paludibacteraceae bacterium]|nr:hypothetical protein [Paludibacteraceae bacterium]